MYCVSIILQESSRKTFIIIKIKELLRIVKEY